MGRPQIPVAQGVVQILADRSVASFAAPASLFAGEVGQHRAVDLLVENLQILDFCLFFQVPRMEARCRGSHVIDAAATEFGDTGHKQVVVVFQAEVADDLAVVSRQFFGLFEDLVRTLPTKK